MSGTKTCRRGHTYPDTRKQCEECKRVAAEELRNGRRKNDTQGVIPANLVAPLVERAIVEHESQRVVSELTGVPQRRLYEIRHGLVEKSSIDLVDRLLVGLNLLELWYLPAPDGFADWYVDEEPAEPDPWQPSPITLYRKGVRTPETRRAIADSQRRYWKGRRGEQVEPLPPARCRTCRVLADERTPGCRACSSRHWKRKQAA